MNKVISFDEFYARQLEKLRLDEEVLRGKTMLVSTHWFFNILPRVYPEIIGGVMEKPRQQKDGTITGNFRAMTGIRGPIWNLANAIEKQFGVESEVVISLELPYK